MFGEPHPANEMFILVPIGRILLGFTKIDPEVTFIRSLRWKKILVPWRVLAKISSTHGLALLRPPALSPEGKFCWGG